MKVIFLDIHGVLCCARSAAAYGGYPAAGNPSGWYRFDRCAITLLQAAIKHTGARVVLSSNWRESVNIDALEYCLGVKFVGTTRASSGDTDTRGARVADWLAANPSVTQYAILDDDMDFNPDQMPKLCLSSKRNGFLLGHYDQLCELMGAAPE